MTLQTDYGKRTVMETVYLFQRGQLNLSPGFQRQSVWSNRDRERLIQSLVSGFPLPNIFLYRRASRGKTVYDVIDGKQRLETILMFLGIRGYKRQRFKVRLALDGGESCWWDWLAIKRRQPEVRQRIECFPLQTAEVAGELHEIVDLFVRINSTGKRLTSGEQRHARFYNTRFLKEADRLLARNIEYFRRQRILSRVQIDRMKGTELFCELLMSIHHEGLINKKSALDKAMANAAVNGNTLNRVTREFTRTLGIMKKLFPSLKETRFRNTVEFYSLFMLVWEMEQARLVLSDKGSARVAFELLRKLSTGVDELREQYRQARQTKPQPPYSDYLLTVQGDTDSLATRQRRANVLRGLIQPLFERKDGRRIFSPEQRRIIWNSDLNRKCSRCRRNLVWEDFTVDHVIAHVRGGRTRLENAQLMCRSCNSRKGTR